MSPHMLAAACAQGTQKNGHHLNLNNF